MVVRKELNTMKSYKDLEIYNIAFEDPKWKTITDELDILGIKIHNFINYVENNWKT
jgi:hypothetical protein